MKCEASLHTVNFSFVKSINPSGVYVTKVTFESSIYLMPREV